MRAVSVEDLKPGMILARTLVNDDMIVILSENTLLTKAHITRLTFLNIPVVYVKDEYELSKNYQTVAAIFNRGNAFLKDYTSVVSAARRIIAARDTALVADLGHMLQAMRLAALEGVDGGDSAEHGGAGELADVGSLVLHEKMPPVKICESQLTNPGGSALPLRKQNALPQNTRQGAKKSKANSFPFLSSGL